MKSLTILLMWILWATATVALTISIIGMVIVLDDDWVDMGTSLIRKL